MTDLLVHSGTTETSAPSLIHLEVVQVTVIVSSSAPPTVKVFGGVHFRIALSPSHPFENMGKSND